METFYLGVHHPEWLAKLDVPLFVSRRRLAGRRSLPRARTAWALDSGGFSELLIHGQWVTSASEYAREVRRFSDEVGQLQWAAIQDWMCEPAMLKKSGLCVEEHQRRTIDNYERLLDLAPELPWVPVLQGWSIGDYWEHQEAYEARGHNLATLPLVGIGSVCRRQGTTSAGAVIHSLWRDGLRLHGFGFKASGLRGSHDALHSADSMAWSLNARKNPPHPDCAHSRCSNCPRYAVQWREDLLGSLDAAAAAAIAASSQAATGRDVGGGSVQLTLPI